MYLFTVIALTAINFPASLQAAKDSASELQWSVYKSLDKESLAEKPALNMVDSNLKDSLVHAGETVELTCEVAGTPIATINWYHNGNLIQKQEGNIYEKLHNAALKTLQNGITYSKLVIPCITKAQRGKYTCLASNGYQTIEKVARISVAGQLEECAENHGLPYISMFTDGRFEFSGNAVQLMCRTQPGNTVAWYSEDRKLLNDHPEFEVYPNGDLMIKKAEWKHMGGYTCVVSNDNGEERKSTFFYPTNDSNQQAVAVQEPAIQTVESQQ